MLDPLKSVRKADALDLLKSVQAEIELENVDSAVQQLQRLQKHLLEWQRSEQIIDAREWLDNALAGEMLAFNTEKAKHQIAIWCGALNEDESTAEVDAYETRVREQSKRKQEAIHVRGVTAHCDELFQKAAELETSATPPNPDFVIANYYSKALNIASAAKEEVTGSPELDILLRKAEQLHENKVVAARIYPMALEDNKFTEALHTFEKLPADMTVPRYVASEGNGNKRITFTNMVAQDAARVEIRQQAQTWAEEQVARLMTVAQRTLDDHEPQEAVDTLEESERMDKLLTNETLIKLNDLRQKATTTLQSKRKAEELVGVATKTAPDNDVAAWETLTQAENLYQWIDALPEARKTVSRHMKNKLERMVQQADHAFHNERDMDRVRDLHRQAQSNYTDKDDSLNDLLEQLNEFNNMTQQYDEYLRTATELHKQVKDLLWEDAVAANDLLTQLESYPEIVLEAFQDLYETRQQVNARLSADTLYGDLYRSLFEQDMEKVRGNVEKIGEAINDYPQDNRFPILRDALNMHIYFLRAQQQLQAGQAQEAAEALQAIAAVNGHPDQQQAQKMLQQMASPPPEANNESE